MKRLYLPSASNKLNQYAFWIRRFFWIAMFVTVNLLAFDILLGIIVDGVFLQLAMPVAVFLLFLICFNVIVVGEFRNPS